MIKHRTLDTDENLYLKSAIDITFLCFTYKSVRSTSQLICNSSSSIRSKIADSLLMMIIQFTIDLFHSLQ